MHYYNNVKLFNTLSRQKEDFIPIDGCTARIYSCGPTVYNTATIGNLRAYIFTDVLKKTIELAGFSVFDVMNTTDVGHLVSDADDGDDKVESTARKLNTTPQVIARKYTDLFFADCKKLNIRRPAVVAPATHYIQDMIEFIKVLEEKGFTYITDDGVYFDSSRFPDYNKLSRAVIGQNKAGARVDIGQKHGINDFALWKFINPNSMQKWSAPWSPPGGKACDGAPGWHIECSTIALKHLGETFDIHTGGIDHIPTHHTNEIAQTESLTGKPMAKFWIHNEFITVNGGKMSKSIGNTYIIEDLELRGFKPLAYRYYCLLTHYRSILNFTWSGLRAAQNAYDNLIVQLVKHYNVREGEIGTTAFEKPGVSALFEDLNTPKALAYIWEILKRPPSREIYNQIIYLDRVLSLDLEKSVSELLESEIIPDTVRVIAEKRLCAKKNKDFILADNLRKEIVALGYEINDTKDGYTITAKTKQ
jgi:cysteinyl-tRNA synthetase